MREDFKIIIAETVGLISSLIQLPEELSVPQKVSMDLGIPLRRTMNWAPGTLEVINKCLRVVGEKYNLSQKEKRKLKLDVKKEIIRQHYNKIERKR